MFARVHLKIGSLIGLLTILMATLAPTISHIVAAGRHVDASCAMHSMDMHSMGGMHSMHEMHMMHDGGGCADESMPHSAATYGDDCGYCSFFAHMPAVPTIEVPLIAIAWAIEHRKATHFESVRRHEPLTFAQPRAPPVLP